MRTIVDFPEEQLRTLDAKARVEGISRAEAVRRAVERYVAAADGDGIRSSFGTWTHIPDADEFVRKIRDEWER